MNKLIDEKQAAALLQLSVKCLQGWRYRGGGPKFLKLGRLVRYTMSDVEDLCWQRSARPPAIGVGAPFSSANAKNHTQGGARATGPGTRARAGGRFYPAHETR